MEIKDKIKSRRLELGLTLEEVAGAVGVAKSTVKKWESGQIASMRQTKIAALAKILKVQPTYLVIEDEPINESAVLMGLEKPMPPDGMTRVTIHGRDGKTEYADFTPEQVELIRAMIEKKKKKD